MFYKNGFAIIGVGCRFPGGINSLDGLWRVLSDGVSVVGPVPEERFDLRRWWHPDRNAPGRSCVLKAGIVGDLRNFDPAFFGMSQKEAEALDPQQRMMLEMTWEAFEDAGIKPSSAAGTKTAVYVGAASADMALSHSDDPCLSGPYSMTGTQLSIIANRISYFFDLHGPSMTVDTACSSSLVALNEACRAMEQDGCPMAVVGGVNVLLSPMGFVGFSKAHMLSEDGACKVFDASGNGYVRAEGGAVLIIKPVEAARRDGDRIYAVIRSIGVNSDGRTQGIALPNGRAQSALLEEVYGDEQVDLKRLAYLEAHGTGTAVGDPIETHAIGEAVAQKIARPLLIGSVKANLGHLETASGMAGIAKALMILQERKVPANILLKNPNPKIDFGKLNLNAPTEITPLPEVAGLPLIGINSFGFGGTNAHVLIEDAPQKHQEPVDFAPGRFYPLILSARSRESLQGLAESYADLLQGADEAQFNRIAAAVARQRELLPHRLAICPKSIEEALRVLRRFAVSAEVPEDASAAFGTALAPQGRTAFIYSGNGSQWAGMGGVLYQQEAVFRETVDAFDRFFEPLSGWKTGEYLKKAEPAWDLSRTEIAQPLLFAVQAGLTAVLRAYGLEPEAAAGHSVGEVAAAWAAGALTLEDAARVIFERSALQGETYGSGSMAAAKIDEAHLHELLRRYPAVEIAGFNAPENYTLSGDGEALDEIGREIKALKGLYKRLPLEYAFHSSRMEMLEGSIRSHLEHIRPQKSAAAFYSTVTGAKAEGDALNAEYWWRNIRQPVNFEGAVNALLDDGFMRFIEIGPHAILSGYIRTVLKKSGRNGTVLKLMSRGDSAKEWMKAVPKLLTEIELPERFWPKVPVDRRLPRYAWNRRLCWLAPTAESHRLYAAEPAHPLLGWAVPHAVNTWENRIDTALYPWIAGHEIDATVLFPAAGFLETALAAARMTLSPDHAVEIDNLAILRPLALNAKTAKVVRTSVARDGTIELMSRDVLSTESPLQHLKGRAAASDAPVPPSRQFPPAEGARVLDVEALYEVLSGLGLAYKDAFRALESAWQIEGAEGTEIVAELKSRNPSADVGMKLSPALVDGALQSLFFLIAQKESGAPAAYLPSWFGRSIFWTSGTPRWCVVRLRRLTERSAKAEFDLYGEAGEPLARLTDVRFLRVHHKELGAEPQVYCERWEVFNPLRREAPRCLENAAGSVAQLIEHALSNMELDASTEEEHSALIEWLALSYIRQAVRQTDEWLPEESLFQDGFSAALEDYSAWLVRKLVDCGLAESYDGMVKVNSSESCPCPETLMQTLLADAPAEWPLMTEIVRIGTRLKALVSGDVKPEAILSGRKNDLGELSSGIPRHAALSGVMRGLLDKCAAKSEGACRLQYLIISRRGGEAAKRLIRDLSGKADLTVLLQEKDALGALTTQFENIPSLTIEPLESFLARSEDDADGRQFDLAALPEGIHEHADVMDVLKGVRRALRTGGLLFMLEEAPNIARDFIAGVDPSWWRHEGSDVFSSLAAPESWISALKEAGFDDVKAETPGACMPYFLLSAQNASAAAQDPVAEDFVESPRVLLIAPEQQSAEIDQLIEVLKEKGAALSVLRHPLSSEMLKASLGTEGGRCRIVLASGFNAEAGGAGKAFPAELFDDLKAVAECTLSGAKPQEVEVTALLRSAAGIGSAASAADDDQAGAFGFLRVARNEFGGLSISSLSLEDASEHSVNTFVGLICDRIAGRRTLDDAAVLDGTVYVPRVAVRKLAEVREIASGDLPKKLTFDVPGKLSRLKWTSFVPRALGENEVRIRVRATPLNFRDVMWASGMLPEEALENGFSGPTMGLEAAGIVESVGSRVTNVRPGDAVMAFAPACFSTEIITRADAVMRKPDGLTFAEAATIPTPFFTAWYAISYCGRAQAGEKILIHGAAGGVGLAAIQLAAHLGLEVYATAGSEEKRAVLKALGVEHIYSSRSLAFADQIKADTGGHGVDLVLNSLAGDGAAKSLDVLAPFGRFLELGKRDFYADSPMFLRPFRRNISYFGIDVDQLLVTKPELAATFATEVLQHFGWKTFRPLPYLRFDAADAPRAFQTMQASLQIGKIVVAFDDVEAAEESREDQLPQLLRPRVQYCRTKLDLDPEGTYLITGGLGGLGRKTAERLAERGARYLVLVSRHGAQTDEARGFVAGLEKRGVRVLVPELDAAAEDFVQRISLAISVFPPLKGIIHAAGVIRDQFFARLTKAECDEVWRTKVAGAENLDELSRRLKATLDFFVLFSSATVLFGNVGQANYVAANAAMQALAARRIASGRTATIIGWGPVGDVGMLQSNHQARRILENALGAKPLTSTEVLDAMEALLSAGIPSAHYFAADWSRLADLPAVKTPRMSDVLAEVKHGAVSSIAFADALRGKTEEEAVQMLVDCVAKEAASLLGLAQADLNVNQPVADLGMDSLMVVELAAALEERTGMKIPAVSLSGGATVRTIAERFYQMMSAQNKTEQDVETIAAQHGLRLSDEMKAGVIEAVDKKD